MVQHNRQNTAPGSLAAWLATRVEPLRQNLAQAARTEARWSVARLAAFAMAALAWIPFRASAEATLAAVLACVGLFAWTIRQHRQARAGHEFLQLENQAAEEARRRLGGTVTAIRGTSRPAASPIAVEHAGTFLPAGRTWPLSEQERDDLDLYAAPVGLFGLINRTSTDLGAMRLRDDLENLCLEPARILARQEAVRWLAEHHDPRQQLLARLAALRSLDSQMAIFEQAVPAAEPVLPAWGSWLLRLWTPISTTVAGLTLVAGAAGDFRWSVPFGVVLLVNLVIWAPMWSNVRRRLLPWERCSAFAARYLEVARQATADLPERTALTQLRAALHAVQQRRALPGAMRWVAWISGGFGQMLLDLFAFYDVHLLEGISRHVRPHRRQLVAGLAAMAELEALLSLACFAAEQPVVCWPAPAEGMQLSIETGSHPLIDPAHVVANDLSLAEQPRLWIITGSNMSGKSTYLRMIGVNVVLAQAGGMACARRMTWSPVRLLSDLRIRDNLNKGESYFLAEVRQLRRMIVPAAGGTEPILGLVDEPFRGTNHREQRGATMAILEHLVESRGMFLIATHDATITRMADDRRCQNRHFQEQLGERELLFDYRLREGPARTRNAIRVLEREQYPADLVRRALAHADQAETP